MYMLVYIFSFKVCLFLYCIWWFQFTIPNFNLSQKLEQWTNEMFVANVCFLWSLNAGGRQTENAKTFTLHAWWLDDKHTVTNTKPMVNERRLNVDINIVHIHMKYQLIFRQQGYHWPVKGQSKMTYYRMFLNFVKRIVEIVFTSLISIRFNSPCIRGKK